MATSKEEADGTIISSTLENGGVVKAAPIGVAVKGGVGIAGRGVGEDSGIGLKDDSAKTGQASGEGEGFWRSWFAGGASSMLAPVRSLSEEGMPFGRIRAGILSRASGTIAASRAETDCVIISSTLKSGGIEKETRQYQSVWPFSIGKEIVEGLGSGSLRRASTTMTASCVKTVGAIVSSILENGGAEKTVPTGVAIEWMGSGSLGGASAAIAMSWGKTVATIVSGTLKNGGEETMGPVGAVSDR
ncbi:hypothetical protein ARMSODRAFT_974467 [Armillaria solidipes]|uniref:Uncharacterized protein n=1 Tax=Armillaria solidipes TaxID=1076256 RepID=A0A2H3C328_9AGAR|nr:hypothetical protein ARMSODRAFT_974467 [Armillaria solidipes]